MANPALKTDSFVPLRGVSPEHEKLVRRLLARSIEIARTEKHVAEATLVSAADVGYTLIGLSNPHPPALNMGVDDSGEVLFTLFGAGGRAADVWISDGSGSFHFVATFGEAMEEGELSRAEAGKLTEWLGGRSKAVIP